MSTSDSDYSLDWLASDEDDCDSPKRSSPQRTEDPPVPPQSPSPSSSSSREPPPDHLLSSSTQRRRRRTGGSCDCKDGGGSPAPLQAAAVSPLQGFTSVYTQQTPPPSRKRAHGVDGLCEKPRADAENEKFSHKCTELQCYIQPLSSILRGLRSGRYSERLSSFQESVAMDRIQRIMGVLQNPNMGGRFLGIVLKIEEMLHSWFPHIKPDLSRTDGGTPAKKQKQCLSSASLLPSSPDVESALAASDSSTRLKWLHTSPICSLKAPESSPGRPSSSSSAAVSSSSPPSREVTQDNAVSSSSDSRLTAPRRLSRGPPPPFKISSPCLERLLQAKESIIAPRTVGGGGWLS